MRGNRFSEGWISTYTLPFASQTSAMAYPYLLSLTSKPDPCPKSGMGFYDLQKLKKSPSPYKKVYISEFSTFRPTSNEIMLFGANAETCQLIYLVGYWKIPLFPPRFLVLGEKLNFFKNKGFFI